MTTNKNMRQFLDDQSTSQWQEILFNTLTELHTEADLQSKLRERRIVQFWVLLFAGFLVSLFLRDALFDIIDNWSKGDWRSIFKALATFFPLLAIMPGILTIFTKYKTILDQGLPLRAILAQKDVVLPATIQPSLLKDQETSITSQKIGPLKRWKVRAIISGIAGIFFLLLCITMIVVLILVVPFNTLLPQPGSFLSFLNSFFIFLWLGLGFLFTGMIGYLCLVSAWQVSSGASVTADQWEIRWRQSRQGKKHRARIAWHEVQGFYCISYQDHKKRKVIAYLLDGPDTAFTWKISDRSSQEIVEASELLTRTIVTSTRQPLRDLSTVAMELFRSPVIEEQNSDLT